MRVYRILREPKTMKRIGERPETEDDRLLVTLVTDDSVGTGIVTAAWSYALRYSAKGLDVPDYEAAVQLMLSRHPSWKVESVRVTNIGYDRDKAEDDQSET